MNHSIPHGQSYAELFSEEALRGERLTFIMRWWIMGSCFIATLLMVHFGRYPQATGIGAALLGAGLACNAVIGLYLRKGRLPVWLSYLAVTLDVGVISGYHYLASHYVNPIMAATSATYLIYPLVLFYVALRHNHALLIYALLLTLATSNLAYYLHYPLMDKALIAQIYSADPIGIGLRSLYLAMFGVSLYFLPRIISRLLDRQARLTAAQREAEDRHRAELESLVAERTAELRQANQDLRRALDEVQTLSGLLPICTTCKKIRDDQGYWQGVEDYIRTHSQADFTHGICPDCLAKIYPQVFERMQLKAKAGQGPRTLESPAHPTKEEPS